MLKIAGRGDETAHGEGIQERMISRNRMAALESGGSPMEVYPVYPTLIFRPHTVQPATCLLRACRTSTTEDFSFARVMGDRFGVPHV